MHASVSMHTAWALRMVSALTSHTLRRYTSPSFVKPATNIRIGAMLVGRGAVHGLSFFVKKIYKRKKIVGKQGFA